MFRVFRLRPSIFEEVVNTYNGNRESIEAAQNQGPEQSQNPLVTNNVTNTLESLTNNADTNDKIKTINEKNDSIKIKSWFSFY